MKTIISIFLLSIFVSCECINDYDTPRENIPEQNSSLNLINLSVKRKSLDIYNNDIFIEKLVYKNSEQNFTKYISGNSIINSRVDGTSIFATPVSLLENEKYIGFIFDFNSSLNLSYSIELKENNIRIWNLKNENVSFRIFSNDILENFDLPFKNYANRLNLQDGSYQIIITYSGKSIESNIQVNQNNRFELIIYNDELIKFEY